MKKKNITFLSKVVNIALKFNSFWLGFSCLLFIIIVWSINYYFPNPFGKYLIMTKVADNGAVLFGITSGLLSLMGLLAIFVSITTQQQIEKCRQNKWELEELRDSLNIEDPGDFKQKMGKFNILINSYIRNIQPNEITTRKIIDISRLSIFFITLLWTLFVSTYNFNEGNESYFVIDRIILFLTSLVGITVMLLFNNILVSLTKIQHSIDLPKTEELTNAANQQIPSLQFASFKLAIEKGTRFLYGVDDLDELKTKINEWQLNISTNHLIHNYYIELIGLKFGSFTVFNGNYGFADSITVEAFEKYKHMFSVVKINNADVRYKLPIDFRENNQPENGDFWDYKKQKIYYKSDIKSERKKDEEINISFLFRLYSFNEEMEEGRLKIKSSVFCSFQGKVTPYDIKDKFYFSYKSPDRWYEREDSLYQWIYSDISDAEINNLKNNVRVINENDPVFFVNTYDIRQILLGRVSLYS